MQDYESPQKIPCQFIIQSIKSAWWRLSLYALSTIARSLANWSELAVIDPSSAQKVITAYLPIPIGGLSERLRQYSCMEREVQTIAYKQH